MFSTILKKVFGTRNDRELKRIQDYVVRVNALESGVQGLSDAELQARTPQFRQRIANGESLESILPEAFAVAREAGKRVLNMRHFDVQLIGGVVLHEGRISEMKTGEGKTLVATLPVYLNALAGKGVHVVTVNEYLAKRDSHWMGQLYRFLGLSVGTIYHDMPEQERKQAYLSDVTYGTNNEFAFDYLRDNMKFSVEQFVQRALNFAIVDEVDSILIDEARTPLIISGPAEESTDKYYQINRVIPSLHKETHYQVDEKAKSVMLTEEGVARVEQLLSVENLYDPSNIETLHHVNQGLRAHVMYKNEVDYVVKDGQVIIIDEFTGRMMIGRRYSDGLHQALEAKEGVKIENENQTLASISFQNFFRMYKKLAGMTGTADTEAAEFHSIYKLEVVVIPTNRQMIRKDHPDVIYRTKKEKYDAVIQEIRDLHEKGQPVLVGTISIETSELLSRLLKRTGIPHNVLNAKHHEREAEIIAQAGQRNSVTIATNMAGRGTDIVLGAGIPELGGLHILGTERHEARRIDNQLRGRSGRQGDPGSSRFYLSLEDDLLRIFGSDRISGLMARLGMDEGQPIEHNMVSKAVANAQAKVEAHNFDIRKHLLEYDDVMNRQREVLYALRREVLSTDKHEEVLFDMAEEVLESELSEVCHEDIFPEEWDVARLNDFLEKFFSFKVSKSENGKALRFEDGAEFPLDHADAQKLHEAIIDKAVAVYRHKLEAYGMDIMQTIGRGIMLQVIDTMWKDHLLNMDHLKDGIGLRGYAQKNPLTEYKKEGFEMFQGMMQRIKEGVTEYLYKVRVERAVPQEMPVQKPKQRTIEHRGGEEAGSSKPATVHREEDKVGRNDPCPCGSGIKYKKCHGK